MRETSPVMYVFAGNNGSGKSTIRNLIADSLGISIHIDPDALARRLDSAFPEQRKVSAGKAAIRLARDCIAHHRSFSIETTLAGGHAIRLMQLARENGFDISLFYIGLGDYRLNIERVATRVKNGGHHISSEDIIRRHTTSMRNLLAHIHLIDHLIVIDNNQPTGEIVLDIADGHVHKHSAPLPDWAEAIRNKFIPSQDL